MDRRHGSELGFPFSGTKLKPASPLNYPECSNLLCYHELEDLLWQNPRYDTYLINYGNSVAEPTGESIVTVFPNPVKEDLSLRFGDAKNRSIAIYDGMGRKVLSLETAEQQIRMKFENLPFGIYFIKVNADTGTTTLKCVKL